MPAVTTRASSAPRRSSRLTTVIGRRARERRLDGDRARGPTRPEDDDVESGGVDDGAQRLDEALPVGVVPDEVAVVRDDGVDGADDLGGLGEQVEVVDDRDLVRQRAVEARPAHRPGPRDGVAERPGGDLAVEVARVEAVVAVRGLDHDDGRVARGRGGEGAGVDAEEGRPGHRAARSVRSRARWTSPCESTSPVGHEAEPFVERLRRTLALSAAGEQGVAAVGAHGVGHEADSGGAVALPLVPRVDEEPPEEVGAPELVRHGHDVPADHDEADRHVVREDGADPRVRLRLRGGVDEGPRDAGDELVLAGGHAQREHGVLDVGAGSRRG